MVLTRGKMHGNAEGDSDRLVSEGEANDEDLYDDQPMQNRTVDEKRNMKSDFNDKLLETPTTPNGSSFSQNPPRPSRSSSKKGKFVFDLSCEESALAIHLSNTESNKGKRLKLYSEEEGREPRRKSLYIDDSSSEIDEDNSFKRVTRRRSQYYNEGDPVNLEEHGDGIRRSTRQRKLLYGSFNTSWIFGTQTVKGYPTFEEEEAEGKRRSRRIQTRQTDDMDVEGVEDGDQEVEEREEEEEEGEGTGQGCTGKSRNKRKPAKRNRRLVKTDKQSYEDDMYSRVKRLRRSATHYASYRTTISNATKPRSRNSRNSRRRRRYPMLSEDSSLESESENDEDIEPEIADEEEEQDEEKNNDMDETKNLQTNESQVIHGRRAKGKYLLRRIQPIVDRFQSIDTKQSSRSNTPPRMRPNSNHRSSRMICSPAHRTLRKRRQTAQNKSSTSSSSSDDERFERRKNKSMVKARNRCMPMNFSPEDLQGIIRDRQKIGSSLADVDPMNIDRNVTFEHIGGLESYIRSLKEMILFPLLYPEVFQKFAIQPPRGVLFYGPPGTGKTLVARALANECSQQDRRVAFFMRKGADCLSKWVGESERQLRLLFDQAYQMRPSIIFFDEIDGLAPVRSTRQDQIHSSIVSTLLALMDGLDSRGEVVVIGATNRLDAIDPALRRPGRFDREFHFPLPSLPARREILGIHLKSWQPTPPANLINYLSEKTVGYCGADLKALCAEAALLALRRRYPQVYQTKDKLLLDLSQILVDRRDFIQAVHRLVPASQRTYSPNGKPLSGLISPLLTNALNLIIQKMQKIFPQGVAVMKVKGPLNGAKLLHSGTQFLPRLMIQGDGCAHLGSALLHYMERLPVHRFDLTTLHGLSVRSPEEASVQLFQEAKRNVPSVLYVPLVGKWWRTVSETVKATFFTLLNEMDPELPVCLLATHDGSLDDCADDFFQLFDEEDEMFHTPHFTATERRRFFQPIFLERPMRRPIFKRKNIKNLEVLPVAPPPPPRQLSETEKARIERKEEATLRELRIFLREILAKLARNKLFYMFTRPVDIEEVPDYLEIIRQPMDLETMMTKIDQHCYESAKDFLADIELICNNALEYNPDRDPEDKLIRHRACTLRDTAYALIKAEMDTDFEEQCQEISRTRKVRNTRLTRVPENLSNVVREVESKTNPVNGEIIEQELCPASNKNRRKRSQWAKGVIGNRRPVKKGKTETDNEYVTPENSLSTTQPDVSAEQDENEPVPIPEVEQSIDEVNDTLADDSQGTESADQVDLAAQPVAEKVVVISKERLEQLLETAVAQTDKYCLDKLLRLYSKLSRSVDRYSKLWDRTSLIQDLEHILQRSAPA